MRLARLRARRGAEPPERGEAVVDDQQRQRFFHAVGAAVHQGGGGAGRDGPGGEVVAVEARAFQGDEEIARRDAARIDGDAGGTPAARIAPAGRLASLLGRSDKRRVGKEWVSSCRYRW